MNRDHSYYRKQCKRAIRRKEETLRRIGGKAYVHAWRMGRQVVLQRARFIAPAGCAAESLMMIRRSGINGWQWMLLSSYARLSESYYKNASRPKLAKHRRLWVGSVFDHID